jgi:hypothetical protein
LSPSPILRALSSIRKSGAKTLLMGGQACVFYGAAEFSRDLDLLILVDSDQMNRLLSALDELDADPVAVPPFSSAHLQRGHAVHFRCKRADVAGLRIDLIAALRGVAPFHELWDRRTTFEIGGEAVDVLALPDLVLAKKTQRDKDWPMIRRLVESAYVSSEGSRSREQVEFLFRELRSPELLIALAAENPDLAASQVRPAVVAAIAGDRETLERELQIEEAEQRRLDRIYWDPLKRELEQLRRTRDND